MSQFEPLGGLSTFNGFAIVEHPHVQEFTPKFKLSAHVAVSDKFRQEFDNWLLETFGQNRVFVYMFSQQRMLVHPNTKRYLDQQLSQQNFGVGRT